jgi:hypothetical protein
MTRPNSDSLSRTLTPKRTSTRLMGLPSAADPGAAGLYLRLRAAGKKPKVALNRGMRKLLIRLNAMIRHQTTLES